MRGWVGAMYINCIHLLETDIHAVHIVTFIAAPLLIGMHSSSQTPPLVNRHPYPTPRQHPRPPKPASLRIYEAHVGMGGESEKVRRAELEMEVWLETSN